MEKTTKNAPDYLVLINKDNRMPEDFLDTIRLVSLINDIGDPIEVEEKAYEAYLRLQKDLLENDGLQINIRTSYRSVQRQEEVFQKNLEKYGLEQAKKYVAVPGYSEHHSGLAIDVTILKDGEYPRARAEFLAMDDLYQIVHKKLPRYGFILRYLKGKEAIHGYGYEPWHFRYIDSPEIAKEITDRGICFEEYCLQR